MLDILKLNEVFYEDINCGLCISYRFWPNKKKKKPIGRVRVWHHAASVWVEFSQKTLTTNPICLAKNAPS